MDLIITLSEGLTDTVAPYFTLSRDPTPPARLTAVADRANGEWGFQFGAIADETAGRATDVSAGYHADIVDLNDLGTTVAQFLKQREQYRGVNLLFGTLRYADDHAFSRSRETAG